MGEELKQGFPIHSAPVPSPFSPSDIHHLRAAEGWLELGDHLEGSEELDKITPELRAHPDVLLLRWQIYREGKKWDGCLEIGRTLTESFPGDPRGWLLLAQSLYHQKRYQEAYDLAVSKITSFPSHWPLYYDSACYACLTGRLDQARKFLELAMAMGDAKEIKLRALHDPDLELLWKEQRSSG